MRMRGIIWDIGPEIRCTAILREVAKFLIAMILAHAQFVLRTPVDTFEFVRHVILEGGATAKETPVAEAEPDIIAESGPRPTVSIFRKTNYACAKIIAVRNLQLQVKLQYRGFQVGCPIPSSTYHACAHRLAYKRAM